VIQVVYFDCKVLPFFRMRRKLTTKVEFHSEPQIEMVSFSNHNSIDE